MLLLVGPTGVGNSHLAQAKRSFRAIKAGFRVLYRSIFDTVRELLQDEAYGGENNSMRRYLGPDLLIVGDMGLKQVAHKAGECLFEIVMRRYKVRSTVMTSNRSIEEWGKLLGDVPSATAILDRFLHHTAIGNIIGKNYRNIFSRY